VLKIVKELEIYDGDIVRVYTYIDEDEPKFNEFTIHKVFWGGMKYPAFELFPNLGDDSNGFSSILCGDYFEALEVIGNIHETPELLLRNKKCINLKESSILKHHNHMFITMWLFLMRRS